MRASAIKYDWLVPVTLAAAAASRQARYAGTEEIDADDRFHERGLALAQHRRRPAFTVEHPPADGVGPG